MNDDHRTDFDRLIERDFGPRNMQYASGLVELATGGRSASDVRDTAIFVRALMKTALLAAQDTFGKEAGLEHALAMYDRMIDRLERSIDPHARTTLC